MMDTPPSPQFLLRYQFDHRNRIARHLLSIIVGEGELADRRDGDFVRSFTDAHTRDCFAV
jgi:hypothetical protein